MTRPTIGFLLALVLSGLIVSRAVEAQLAAKVPRIGILSPFSPTNQGPNRVDTFQQGLQELGYREGENILMEYR
jgi:hypothetical protein